MLWVICQMEEASIAYNMSFSLAMTIENVPFFQQAVADVVDRHDTRRASRPIGPAVRALIVTRGVNPSASHEGHVAADRLGIGSLTLRIHIV